MRALLFVSCMVLYTQPLLDVCVFVEWLTLSNPLSRYSDDINDIMKTVMYNNRIGLQTLECAYVAMSGSAFRKVRALITSNLCGLLVFTRCALLPHRTRVLFSHTKCTLGFHHTCMMCIFTRFAHWPHQTYVLLSILRSGFSLCAAGNSGTGFALRFVITRWRYVFLNGCLFGWLDDWLVEWSVAQSVSWSVVWVFGRLVG